MHCIITLLVTAGALMETLNFYDMKLDSTVDKAITHISTTSRLYIGLTVQLCVFSIIAYILTRV